MAIRSKAKPLYCVYQAGDRATVCYRAVRENPAPPTDFLSYLDLGSSFEWWDLHRAAGVSAWTDERKAAALAMQKGMPYLAVIDLARAEPKLRWAETGAQGHVTMWAPAPFILQAVISYAETGKRAD
jgi:hypothetical protein